MFKSLVLFALLPSASLFAQSQSEYFMYGGTPSTPEWEVRRTLDTDGDDLFLSANEGVRFAYDGATVVTYVEDPRFEIFAGQPAIFGTGGGDVILKMVDTDNDGLAMSSGEVITFVDTRAAHGISNSSPDGLDFDPNTGMMYVTDDYWSSGPQPGAGISTYIDIDGDGLAMSSGEMTLFVDGTASLTVPGIGGTPVTIGITDFEAIMIDSAGIAIGFEQQDRNLYAFQDLNGDGDAMDAGEAWNFCNLVDDVLGLEVNVDIAAGTLLPPRCVSSTGTGWYATLEALSVEHGAGTNGADVYWIASTASNTSCNAAAGLIYRGEDLNGDLDLNDAGEVVLWLDGPNNNSMLYPVTSLYDAEGHEGGVSIFQGNGPSGASYNQDTVYFLVDNNGDGDAMDSGEQILRYQWAPDGCYAVSMCSAPKGSFVAGPPQPTMEILGTPGVHSNGATPQIGYSGLPGLGQTFDITLANSLPGAVNRMAVGWSDSLWNSTVLPWDLGPIGMPNNWLYVSLDFQFPGANLSTGTYTRTFQVPSDPVWAGRDAYFQLYIVDGAANPRGAVTTAYVHANIQ
jgi:hypothetical protein